MEDEELFDMEAGEEVQSEEPEVEDVYEGGNYESENFTEESDSDYVSKLLETKGINNKTIQIADEYGQLRDVKFEDLSEQEKYDILAEHEMPAIPSDDEINTINYLRQNGMTLQDFANWQKQLGVQEYLQGQQTITETDSYNDDEIIAFDFIKRFGESMSDEEIDSEIERLKADPEAYEKRVALLRDAYKNEEEAQARLYEEERVRMDATRINDFQNAYVDAANNFNYIQGIDLDNNDKEQLLDFVLTKDVTGQTEFSKALDNPEAVLRMAWGLLYGENAFEATSKYYKDQISQRSSGTRAVSRQRTQQKDAFKF